MPLVLPWVVQWSLSTHSMKVPGVQPQRLRGVSIFSPFPRVLSKYSSHSPKICMLTSYPGCTLTLVKAARIGPSPSAKNSHWVFWPTRSKIPFSVQEDRKPGLIVVLEDWVLTPLWYKMDEWRVFPFCSVQLELITLPLSLQWWYLKPGWACCFIWSYICSTLNHLPLFSFLFFTSKGIQKWTPSLCFCGLYCRAYNTDTCMRRAAGLSVVRWGLSFLTVIAVVPSWSAVAWGSGPLTRSLHESCE